jgi:hypothetical protein
LILDFKNIFFVYPDTYSSGQRSSYVLKPLLQKRSLGAISPPGLLAILSPEKRRRKKPYGACEGKEPENFR